MDLGTPDTVPLTVGFPGTAASQGQVGGFQIRRGRGVSLSWMESVKFGTSLSGGTQDGAHCSHSHGVQTASSWQEGQ